MSNILKAVAVLLLATTFVGCSKVPAGNVGVKVYLLGTSKGVDTEELGVGRYWIGINEELYLFPTFTQNYTWTHNADEGDPEDESISFQTMEGLTVNADVGISYHIAPDRVTDIFQKYRRGVDEITDVFLRNMVRDALVTVTSTRPIESVYGSGKADVMAAVEELVREQVGPIGINVEKIYWIGNLRLPSSVVSAIDEKINAMQRAEQRRNEIAEAQAAAEKEIEAARGVAEAKLAVARAEAEAIRLQGEALRQNPEVIRLRQIEKWDGTLPRITGGGVVPFMNVDDLAAKR